MVAELAAAYPTARAALQEADDTLGFAFEPAHAGGAGEDLTDNQCPACSGWFASVAGRAGCGDRSAPVWR